MFQDCCCLGNKDLIYAFIDFCEDPLGNFSIIQIWAISTWKRTGSNFYSVPSQTFVLLVINGHAVTPTHFPFLHYKLRFRYDRFFPFYDQLWFPHLSTDLQTPSLSFSHSLRVFSHLYNMDWGDICKNPLKGNGKESERKCAVTTMQGLVGCYPGDPIHRYLIKCPVMPPQKGCKGNISQRLFRIQWVEIVNAEEVCFHLSQGNSRICITC